jgi:xanthosine utilization system XapX-like protein
MPNGRALKVFAAVAVSFAALVGIIFSLAVANIVSVVMAKLMLVALLGLYVGFGILFAVYRLIGKMK